MLYQQRSVHYSSTSMVLLLLTLYLGCFVNKVHSDDYGDDDEDTDLPYVEIQTSLDFHELGEQAEASGRLILLQVSASYCGYCETLEEEIIKPMLRSGDYSDTVFIRKIELDSYYNITGFDGNETSPDGLAATYSIVVTPTLLFLDSDGSEVAGRIIGINSLDFFGGYVDEAIRQGLQRVR